MIPADLLSALREKDPELWMEITRTELAEIEYCDVDGDECEPDYIYWAGLRSEAQDAWLQHCLQDAIRARGWSGWVGRTALICFAEIHTKGAASRFENNEIFYGQGDTEAEALGWAYLAAIEAIRP